MDVKNNVGSLTSATADSEITAAVSEMARDFEKQATLLIKNFVGAPPTPQQAHSIENQLGEKLRELGRRLIEWLFSQLEPAIEEMPGTVSHREKTHRRLPGKTLRSDIVTRFGKISLQRAGYRRGRAGRMIFPLEILLGIENGFTPAAADRIGKQFAGCGSSQGRTREMIADQTGAKIGTEKLRKLVGTFADGMEPFREEAQLQKLMEWIGEARANKQTPVLSVSRDGVALGLAPWSSFEMAGVACISVPADGKKLGTVYLGRVPETNQVTLSTQLSSLFKETIRRWPANQDHARRGLLPCR